jgi:hypothetical protein
MLTVTYVEQPALGNGSYRVKVDWLESIMYAWCVRTFDDGTWSELFGLAGNSGTYCFQREADALLFVLRWS